MATRTVVWFRRDLRLADNPALLEAARTGVVIPVFVWSPEEEGELRPGRASRWWLKQSLRHLASSLQAVGARLIFRRSDSTLQALLQIVRTSKATHLFYNHLYDPISVVRDHGVKQALTGCGIVVQSFPGDMLYEPWEVYDEEGQAFTKFQAYWNKCQTMPFEPDLPMLPPKRIKGTRRKIVSCTLDELGLEDESEASSNALLAREWSPGWANAEKALEDFVNGPLRDYAIHKRSGDRATTSLLSPHLHYGEISVRKVFYDVSLVASKEEDRNGRSHVIKSVEDFLTAISYREYSRHLIFNFPFTHETSLLRNLRSFPWRWDENLFKIWRQGRTGYPLVDAAMRELWATGWLHNGMRVVVASFCVKFLQLPWRWGMKYFWDTLLDADLESDIMGWQFISGSLPDGHPLDHMDDPTTQGQQFDPHGEYVRRWLPELFRLPSQWIHHPWDTPPAVLEAAGIELGVNYPNPIVEVAAARKQQQRAVKEMWLKEAGFQGPVAPMAPVPDEKDVNAATTKPGSASSFSSSRCDNTLLTKPTESHQQAAATILNVPLEKVIAVDVIHKQRQPSCFCFLGRQRISTQ